jgi:hypothetical protein
MAKKKNILDVKIKDEDSGAKTVREYFKALLDKLFEEGDGFSGKRPFGNSGWEYTLKQALVKSGHVDGKLDGDGCVESCDDEQFYEEIYAAIEQL